ncbi:hypothetical protein VW23_002395 [Devosia insulae DS-56]|uniref:Uncharacterized protein n=1 Tax=Devosia insulae DS-56 TaxID=1116389 RepID=A0A1E5XKN7_9HYPH|nr:hypothetical protein [Devosia insulae]OEO29135.1 hypothetical protein VW23_002395 [Devosia insulae DS-56]
MASRKTTRSEPTGLRQFLSLERQAAWLEGELLDDADERQESVELRFKYLPRYQKLLGRPQAAEVLKLLSVYGRDCLPMPRRTERFWWSVSCLPSTSDKPLVRVNASWMEFFTLYADEAGVRGRFILHLSDFTSDGSVTPEQLDESLVEQGALAPEDVGWFFPNGADMFGIKVRGAASLHKMLASPHLLRAIRRFNLTHMNRGRNAYQASHSYSVADHMIGG